MAQLGIAFVALGEDLFQFPVPTWWFTSISDYRARVLDALF